MALVTNPLTPRPIGGGQNALAPGLPEIRIAPSSNTIALGSAPDPRVISNDIAGAGGAPPNDLGDTASDPVNSDYLYVFGQFVDHDISKEILNPAINRDLTIGAGDPNFPAGTTIPLGGTAATGPGGAAVNSVAGYLDLSQVYGSDTTTAASLRNTNGTLKTDTGNTAPVVGGQFVSGDVRVGENPELTAITSLWIREHNHWVGVLKAQHPTWTGDQLYNTAKDITTAEYQNVIYTEYLPHLIGPKTLGAYPGFNPAVNANVTEEFSTAAFRVGHSQISGEQNRIDNFGNLLSTQTLGQAFLDTVAQSKGADNFSALLRNLGSDSSSATDPFSIDDLRNSLFAPPQEVDLIAIDIQRERDLHLGTLNETRIALGLPAYTSFAQLSSDPAIQALYASTFGNINKVDLFMGGLAENHVKGGAVGQTFNAIIADQFSRLRAGDASFWQNQNLPADLKATISQTTLGDIIERNTGTPVMQQDVFTATQRVSSTLADPNATSPQLVIGVDTILANIHGGKGDDTIVAGQGIQTMTGGGGKDTFVFTAGSHIDTITDWKAGDKLEFQAAVQNAQATLIVNDKGTSSEVVYAGSIVTVNGAHNLAPSNFIMPPGTHTTLLENGRFLT